MRGTVRFRSAQWTAALLLATGTAGSAAFGPELIKSVIPSVGETWWFLSLLILAIAITALGLWQRRKAVNLDTVGIVVAAVDPGDESRGDESRGQTLYANARRYSQQVFVAPVAPFMERLPVDRAAAAARVDSLGDRVNELIGFAEQLAPSASRLNLVLVMRNAAAFRLGMKLGKQHRNPIVVHHSDASHAFPASRLADFENCALLNGLTSSSVTVDDGAKDRACLLLNLQGRGDSTLGRAKQLCAAQGIGHVIEIRHDQDRLPSDQATFEGVVHYTLMAWQNHRPSSVIGKSIVIVDGPAVIALVLGAQLSIHPDGPWTPYEFDNATASYSEFAP